MKGIEIKNKIDFLNKQNSELLNPNIFTLNNTIKDNLLEIDKLQQICKHDFQDGFCIYCYKQEDNE